MNFLENLRKVPVNAEKALSLCERERGFDSVVITGMGGSGITGSIVSEQLFERSKVPVITNRGPRLPRSCGEKSLHVVISYSGNTEETVNAFEEGLRRGCRTVCITSGGKLAGSEREKARIIKIPKGYLPREALFLMLIPALGLFLDLPQEIPGWLEEMRESIETDNSPSVKLAENIGKKIPMIYGSYPFASLALRFKQQVNENCKAKAFFNEFPELNHNEIESFHGNFDDFVVVSVGEGHERSLGIVSKTCGILNMELYGKKKMERLFKSLYFIDFTTHYMAKLRGVDPAAMPNIEELKSSGHQTS